jgi:hypothetical protein
MVIKSGRMELNMKVNGSTIKLMERESSTMSMVTSLTGNGRRIKQMDLECTRM